MLKLMRNGSDVMISSGLEYIGKLLPEERRYIEMLRTLPEEKQREIFSNVEKRFNEINESEKIDNE